MTDKSNEDLMDRQPETIVGRIPYVRLEIQNVQGINPNTSTGLEAWDVAKGMYEDLDEKQRTEFVQEWYAAVNRSQKAEVENGKSRKRGVDKHGNPTNSARVEKLEQGTKQLWSDIETYSQGKNKKIQNIVKKAMQKRDERIEEVRAEFKRKREEKEAAKTQ